MNIFSIIIKVLLFTLSTYFKGFMLNYQEANLRNSIHHIACITQILMRNN